MGLSHLLGPGGGCRLLLFPCGSSVWLTLGLEQATESMMLYPGTEPAVLIKQMNTHCLLWLTITYDASLHHQHPQHVCVVVVVQVLRDQLLRRAGPGGEALVPSLARSLADLQERLIYR